MIEIPEWLDKAILRASYAMAGRPDLLSRFKDSDDHRDLLMKIAMEAAMQQAFTDEEMANMKAGAKRIRAALDAQAGPKDG